MFDNEGRKPGVRNHGDWDKKGIRGSLNAQYGSCVSVVCLFVAFSQSLILNASLTNVNFRMRINAS